MQAKFEKELSEYDTEHGTSEASAKQNAKEKEKVFISSLLVFFSLLSSLSPLLSPSSLL